MPAAAVNTPVEAPEAAATEAYIEPNRIQDPSPVLAEDETLRTENGKHWRKANGGYTIALFPEPVHFKNASGKWQDFDNTLSLDSSRKSVAGRATFAPAASGLDIRVPQDFSDDQMLTISKDGYAPPPEN